MRLALSLELNREDERCSASVSPCANPLCSCKRDQEIQSLSNAEAREERRRVFWLLYCLDRHLALSFNRVLDIPDSYCEIYGKSSTCTSLVETTMSTNKSQHHCPRPTGKASTPRHQKTYFHGSSALQPPSAGPASSSTSCP